VNKDKISNGVFLEGVFAMCASGRASPFVVNLRGSTELNEA
jgi:orotate phosphoribosyltransferase